MTTIIGKKEDKNKSLDLFERICKMYLFGNMQPKDQAAVNEHLAWMKRNPNDLRVNCKLETVPELQLTRIVLEFAHIDVKPLSSTRQ